MTARDVTITERALLAVRRHAEQAWPSEACGLLVAREGLVLATRPLRNSSGRTDRFAVDPLDYLEAELETQLDGNEVVGLYHSHDGDAVPSRTDSEGARHIWPSSPGWPYLVAGMERGRVRAVRSWVLAGPRFVETTLTWLPSG